MSRHSIDLPLQNVHTTRFRWQSELHQIPRHYFVPRLGINPGHYVSHSQPGSVVFELVKDFQENKRTVKEEHADNERQLQKNLTVELKALTAPPSDNAHPFQRYDLQTAAITQLIEQKRAALAPAWEAARVFYGDDPVNKSIRDYLRIATQANSFPDPKQTWLASYKAAFEARRLAKSVDLLTAKANKVAVERARAQDRLHTYADQHLAAQAQTVEVAQAGLDEARFQHHVDLREMEERLTHFSRHLRAQVSPEAAALHAQDLGEEMTELLKARHAARTSRTEVGRHARQLDLERNFLHRHLTSANPPSASEQNRVDREALLQSVLHTLEAHKESWPEEQQRMASHEAQLESALADARSEMVRLAALEGVEYPQRPATYNVTVPSMGLPQVIAPKASAMAAFESVRPAMGKALLSAGGKVGGVPRVVLYFAALLVFSVKLEEDSRHGLSVPLTNMKLDFDLQQLMDSVGEHFELPMRLISALQGDDSAVRIVPTGSERVPADVRVRAATWDAERGAYAFTSDGPGPVTILWTPSAPVTDSSTSLPADQTPSVLYPGDILVKRAPPFLPFPAEDDVHFDDYIIIFPADSGLEPVYIMFKNPRDYAGVGRGNGRDISGWAEARYSASGAPIPTRIADQLRGRQFSSWRKMREAIWKAMANDAEASKHFSRASLNDMRKGKAPIARDSDHRGKRQAYELHHLHPISKGGAVYDLDNLVILTPKSHVDVHRMENN